jgi:1-acyl-sn-glycerol-3-phosphate acyltransferase
LSAFHSPLVAFIRLCGFFGWTLLVVPPYGIFLLAGRVATCRRIARFYWRVTASILGFRVVVRGEPCDRVPVLFVANHASYLDIIVLGGLIEAAFIAKKEVSQWPGINVLAKLGRTVFVDRRPRKSLTQRDEMLGRLSHQHESLILFPEGTSNDGNRILPFKSALFSVAEGVTGQGRSLPVQPVSVAYTRLDGMPIGRSWRAFYAWYGDMELVSHLWCVLGLGRTTVEVQFHTTVTVEQFGSRKALCDHCHEVISRGVALANAGRLARVREEPPALAAGANPPENVIVG